MVMACLPCNLVASDLMFPSFDAKRDYIRKRRNLPESGIRYEQDIPDDTNKQDETGELVMIDAVWEELDESDETDTSSESYEPCGAVSWYTDEPCVQDKARCPWHKR